MKVQDCIQNGSLFTLVGSLSMIAMLATILISARMVNDVQGWSRLVKVGLIWSGIVKDIQALLIACLMQVKLGLSLLKAYLKPT
jgi:hypothetical protein